jgi:anti-anti-sigma regulatory factor
MSQQSASGHRLRVEIDREYDRSTVTFRGAVVTETQTTVHGVTSMLHGEELVVLDVSDVRLTDGAGIGALEALVHLVRSSGGHVHLLGRLGDDWARMPIELWGS